MYLCLERPKFQLQPSNTTAYEEHSILLHCVATGDPRPTIYWDKNQLYENWDSSRFTVPMLCQTLYRVRISKLFWICSCLISPTPCMLLHNWYKLARILNNCLIEMILNFPLVIINNTISLTDDFICFMRLHHVC